MTILMLTLVKASQGANKYFEALEDTVCTGDPINDWINSPPIPISVDAITYWNGMVSMNHPLSPMALNFLSIPGKPLSL
jgi:hypothetical protein